MKHFDDTGIQPSLRPFLLQRAPHYSMLGTPDYEEWRYFRKLTNPAFSPDNMRKVSSVSSHYRRNKQPGTVAYLLHINMHVEWSTMQSRHITLSAALCQTVTHACTKGNSPLFENNVHLHLVHLCMEHALHGKNNHNSTVTKHFCKATHRCVLYSERLFIAMCMVAFGIERQAPFQAKRCCLRPAGISPSAATNCESC